MGKYSQAVITKSEELATVSMRANNDPSEGMFATFTDIRCSGGRINLSSASGIGQVRYNGDMRHGHEQFITGHRSKKDSSGTWKLGNFHLLAVELQDSLLSICKKRSKQARTNFAAAIAHHREVRAEKLEIVEQLKLDKAEKDLINAAYFFQQYHSPRCWRTVDISRTQYAKLTTKKDRLRCVKEQIMIRHQGFGWEEAYHPWSRNKRHFTPDELLNHLITVVIPLQDSLPIPTKPPISIPKQAADGLVLGTKSAGLVELEGKLMDKEEQIRTNALNERARLEAEGNGDQVDEMQETSWPLERILAGGFKIDMFFSSTDDEGNQFMYWCQGVVS